MGRPKEGVLLSGLDPKGRVAIEVECKEKSSLFCLSLRLDEEADDAVEAAELFERVREKDLVCLGGMLTADDCRYQAVE